MKCRVVVLGGVVTFSLLGLGILLRAHQAPMMALEQDAGALSVQPGAPTVPLATLDRALRHGDIAGAERAWRDAYSVALRGHQWHVLADIGDAAIRIGDVAGERGRYVSRAREAYFASLIRARADRSREGVTRMRHAFRVLGDHEMAQQCAIIAEILPARAVNTTPADPRSASTMRDPWIDP